MFETLKLENTSYAYRSLTSCDCGYNSDITVASQGIDNNLGLGDSGVIGIDFANSGFRSIYDNWDAYGTTYATWPPAIPEPEEEKRYKIKHH